MKIGMMRNMKNNLCKKDDEYFLCTQRLGFRPWREEDINLAQSLWGDPLVTEYIVAQEHLSEDQVKGRLLQEIATAKEHGFQYWPIFLRRSGDHVGCCGLRPYDLPRSVYEFGVHIRSTHWRRGYAFESSCAVIEHAFDTLKVKSLFAGHNPKNEVSRRLLEKLGFRYTHDEFYPPTGLHHPSYVLNADDCMRNR
jgi:ribosomal-protein-alanine N-acetyltransferase